MKTFPMFLKMAGRRVVIFGGGEQAAQKVRLMLKTEAEIVVVAPALEPELATLAASGRVVRAVGDEAGLFAGAALAFVATGAPEEDARLAASARAAGVLVNVVDAPDLCDAYTPSIVDRDPLVVAIGTEGAAPDALIPLRLWSGWTSVATPPPIPAETSASATAPAIKADARERFPG